MSHRSRALSAGLGFAAVAGLCGERHALAQPSQEARFAAAALFEDGMRLMGEGKYPEACPKLAESERLDPSIGTLYRLSLCFEATGRTASAWLGYLDVAARALTLGQADREKAARAKAATLEPKLMRLKITVQPAAASAGVEVKRDGTVVSTPLWGTAVPLDPGPHKVTATAPGKEPWELGVQLDRAGSTVSVDVPPLLEKKATAHDEGSAPQPPGPTVPAGPMADRPPSFGPFPWESRSSRYWQLPLGITLTAAGVAGVATGTVLGVLAKSKFNQTNTGGECDATTNACSPAGLTRRASAVSEGNVATYVFIPGVVVAAAGLVVWITTPSSTFHADVIPAARAQALQIGLAPAGVSLRGAW
jgi:hypothetical protein